jgi:hypothetical protein
MRRGIGPRLSEGYTDSTVVSSSRGCSSTGILRDGRGGGSNGNKSTISHVNLISVNAL